MSALAAYRVATDLGAPLIRLYLARRRALNKEDPDRFPERLGIPGRERPAGPLVWMHAASVGEAVSLLPLVARMRTTWPDHAIMVTTGTVTSARIMAERLPDGAFHQFVPVDRMAYVRRFLDHWRPDFIVWAESELWPNLLTETTTRHIPKVLVQGRMSSRSYDRWSGRRTSIGRLLGHFALCLGQTETDTERLRALGAPNARYRGNLKFAAPPLPVDPVALDDLRRMLGPRPRWLAASTHPGEEDIVADVHQRLRRIMPPVLTIVVPRHPERGPDIVRSLAKRELTIACRSAGQPVADNTDVYVADTIGELGLFYRLAQVAFIGKSLVGGGGQNPLEAAHLGCAVIHGPHMENFAEITKALAGAEASILIESAEDLAATVLHLLSDEGLRSRYAAAGQAIAASHAGVLDAIVDAIAPFMAAPGRPPTEDRSARACA